MPSIKEIIKYISDMEPSALALPDTEFREVFDEVAAIVFGVDDPKQKWRNWSVERQRYDFKAKQPSAGEEVVSAGLCDRYIEQLSKLNSMPSRYEDVIGSQIDDLKRKASVEKEGVKKLINKLESLSAQSEAGQSDPSFYNAKQTFRDIIRKSKTIISLAQEQSRVALLDIDTQISKSESELKDVMALLLPSTFVYVIALFDSFIADAVHYDFARYPELISSPSTNTKSDKYITHRDVFEAKSCTELKNLIFDYEARKITDLPVEKQIEKFKGRGVDFSTIDIDQLRETIATRNLYVHNGGKIGRDYILASKDYWKAKRKKPYKRGDIRPLDEAYLNASIDMVKQIINIIKIEFVKPKSEPIS